ncbi:MAG: acyl-CoA dehydrogenase family protein [Rhodothalassiaceae bacterium]
MADRSYLDWPFLDHRHRALKGDLSAWIDDQRSLLAAPEEDVGAACRALVARLGKDGWLRHTVPAAHGGLSGTLDVRSLCLVREGLAHESALADFAFAMQGLGSGAITLFGSEEQKAAYLPAVARGEKIAAFALSEREAGSDVAAITTRAVPVAGGYRLDGEKYWISNGGIADFYVLFARTGEGEGARGLSAFIVDAATPGFSVSERIPLIAPHPLAGLRLENCVLPREAMLGAPGAGFRIAMATLDIFRSTVGAAALGLARRALDSALERASMRRLFGAPLADLQMTQAALAEMALDIDAAALLVYRAAWTRDSGAERVTREAAMAKLHATEAAQRVIDRAVQLHGGAGVVAGALTERLYREVRALRIYEGASEIQKIIIARQVLAGYAQQG